MLNEENTSDKPRNTTNAGNSLGTPTTTWNFLETTKKPVETVRATTSTKRRHYKIVRHE